MFCALLGQDYKVSVNSYIGPLVKYDIKKLRFTGVNVIFNSFALKHRL